MAEKMEGLTFSVDTVSKKMGEIEGLFADFAATLKAANDVVQTNVNVGEDSAIFGNYGSKIKGSWDENAATFGDFYQNFNNWAALVSAITANNIDLNNEVISAYRSTGDKLDGVQGAITAIKDGSGKPEGDAALVYGQKIGDVSEKDYDKENPNKGVSYEYTDADGNKVKVEYDKDGKPTYKDEKGNEVDPNKETRDYERSASGVNEDGTNYTSKEDKKDDDDSVETLEEDDKDAKGDIRGVEEDAEKKTYENSNGSWRDTYTNPDGSKVEVDYDADGNKKFERYTDKNGCVTETSRYDSEGNQTEHYEWDVAPAGKTEDGYQVYKTTQKDSGHVDYQYKGDDGVVRHSEENPAEPLEKPGASEEEAPDGEETQ